ncbi:unnamed protein product [Clavelina lepadiformis]|uniref:Uncharacterized protein n=1 Tax=Clavelina lepadiformis TaxID=159417 RepID=A0ABP0FB51_CLALP
MNSDHCYDEVLESGIRFICQSFESGKEDDIFQILVHLSPQLGHLLPLNYEKPSHSPSIYEASYATNPSESLCEEDHNVQDSFEKLLLHLGTHYARKVKEMFAVLSTKHNAENIKMVNTMSNDIHKLCTFLQKVQVVLGRKTTEEKFISIVSREMDLLLQHHLTYVANVLSNFKELKVNILNLTGNARQLISNVILILTCGYIYKEKSEVMTFLQETILEKLSIELFTLAGSITDTLNKISLKQKPEKQDNSNQKNKLKFSSAVATDTYLPVEILSGMAEIINMYLLIENDIEKSDIIAIAQHSSNVMLTKGVLKHSFELPDLIRSSQKSILQKSVPGVAYWDWYETLKDLAPYLSASLTQSYGEMTQALLQEAKENSQLLHLEKWHIPSLSSTLLTGKPFPKRVLKNVGSILELVIKLLPFGVLGGRYKPLLKLQTDLLDAVNQSMKELKTFFMNLVEDISEKISPLCLSILLASAADIVAVLQYCTNKMRNDNRVPFHGTLQLYKELHKQIYQHTIQYHKTKLFSSILHDAESNYWEDPREFCEGENCSYSVEMWEVYLKNISGSLSKVYSHEMAKNIVAEIFCDSLSILSNRYCMCLPSYNRVGQTKLDMHSIMLFCSEFLWKVISCTYEICPREKSVYRHEQNDLIAKIHSACSDLFTCFLVLCCPLSDLFSASSAVDGLQLDVTPYTWLSLVKPALFPSGWGGSFNTLPSLSRLICSMKLLVFNPENWAELTFKMLMSDNLFLARNLVSGSLVVCGKTCKEVQLLVLKLFSQQPAVFASLFIESAKISENFSSSMFIDGFNFVRSDQCNDINIFPWQTFILKLVYSAVIKAVSESLEFIEANTWSHFSRHILQKLPSKFHDILSAVSNEDKDDLIYLFTSIVISNLSLCCMGLSETAVHCLVKIDEELSKNNCHGLLQSNHYGSHIVLYFAHLILSDGNSGSSSILHNFPDEVISRLQVIGKNLLSLSRLESSCSNSESLGARSLLKEIRSFKECTDEVFSDFIELDNTMDNLHYQKHENFCFDEEVNKSLMEISHLLQENENYISKQLNMDTETLPPKEFIPDTCDWKILLRNCLASQPQSILSKFVSHRPEMQENAYLNEEEKGYVTSIKTYFGLHQSCRK